MNLRDFLALIARRYAITATKQLAVPVVASAVVIDPIAVANVETVLGAIPPDRALHEPRKRRRKGRVELSRIDVRRDQVDDLCAAARTVAAVAVGMVGRQPLQNPGAIQEIMDQGVDGNEGCGGFGPERKGEKKQTKE